MQDLPLEILALIVNLLGDDDTLRAVEVCSTWRDVIVQEKGALLKKLGVLRQLRQALTRGPVFFDWIRRGNEPLDTEVQLFSVLNKMMRLHFERMTGTPSRGALVATHWAKMPGVNGKLLQTFLHNLGMNSEDALKWSRVVSSLVTPATGISASGDAGVGFIDEDWIIICALVEESVYGGPKEKVK